MNEETQILQQNIYSKFNEARKNMEDLQQIITKYSSNRKQVHPIEVNLFSLRTGSNNEGQPLADHQKPSNTVIKMVDEWEYTGEVFQSKFNGYGILSHEGKLIYSGEFKHGKMHGIGKLNYHQIFQDLIGSFSHWSSYEGEFDNGLISGFGNLQLKSSQNVVVGLWVEGFVSKKCLTTKRALKI